MTRQNSNLNFKNLIFGEVYVEEISMLVNAFAVCH